MKLAEKIGFLFIFALITLGVWFSHTNLEIYKTWYAGPHALLEWLTLTSILACIVACVYRASILAPFRKTSFLIGLYTSAAILLFFGALEGSRRWGLVDDFLPGWVVALMFFAYLVILPLCYLKYPTTRKRVDNWAIPLPRTYHIVLYVVLLVAHWATQPNEFRPEQLQFGACWLFFMVMMEPLNRVVFSRTTIDR